VAPDDQALQALATRVASALSEARLRLISVESCTGGFVAKLLTDLAGSSAWFDSGFVTYSNAAKQRDVGVHPQTLLRHGAVSEAVVREMAEGALARSDADVAVSLSGVAGPTGGTARNPVGSVWIGVARRGADRLHTRARHHQLVGDRDAVRRAAAAAAFGLLLESLGGATAA
jgi:nicotinamide-nucleotide amidase